MRVSCDRDTTTQQKYLEEDLQLTNRSLKLNPKNYSVWEHRKWVLETMPDADWGMEMKMVELYLERDGRNCALTPNRRRTMN
jgi:geranylgeranyl transferase type-2 subunit alpha